MDGHLELASRDKYAALHNLPLPGSGRVTSDASADQKNTCVDVCAEFTGIRLPDAVREGQAGQKARVRRGVPDGVRERMRPRVPRVRRGRVHQLQNMPQLHERVVRGHVREVQELTRRGDAEATFII